MIITLITMDGSKETGEDMKMLFGFKKPRVRPCIALGENGVITDVYAWTVKTSRKNWRNFVETHERYGF